MLDDLAGGHQDLDAGLLEDREDRRQAWTRSPPARGGQQQDPLHRPGRARWDGLGAAEGGADPHPRARASTAWTKTSRLPLGPGSRIRPCRARAHALPLDDLDDPRTASSSPAGRTPPPAGADPLAAHLELQLPSPSHRQPGAGGAGRRPDEPIGVNESPVTRSGSPGRAPGPGWRALMRSAACTRSSLAQRAGQAAHSHHVERDHTPRAGSQ